MAFAQGGASDFTPIGPIGDVVASWSAKCVSDNVRILLDETYQRNRTIRDAKERRIS